MTQSEECIKWAEGVGFKLKSRHNLKHHHYGIILLKT